MANFPQKITLYIHKGNKNKDKEIFMGTTVQKVEQKCYTDSSGKFYEGMRKEDISLVFKKNTRIVFLHTNLSFQKKDSGIETESILLYPRC